MCFAFSATLSLVLTSCGESAFDYKEQSEFVFRFTLSSTNSNFAVNDRVTFLVGDCNNSSCGSITGIHQVFTGTVGAGLTVPVAASVFYDFDRYYFFSMYVDKNLDGVMSSGDVVWKSGDPATTTSFTGFSDIGWGLFTAILNRGTFEQNSAFAGSTYNGSPAPW